MSSARARVQLALDANFPQPILRSIAAYIPEADLHPVQEVDPRMGDLLDWQLVVALYHRGFVGLVTNDYHMFYEPKVLMAAHRTKLNLIAIEALGHDPIRATGALLLDLSAILRRLVPHKPKVYRIKRSNPTPISPFDVLRERADRLGMDSRALIRAEHLTPPELGDPLAKKPRNH